MRYLKYVAMLAVLMVPLAYSQAQVSVGIGFGPVGVAVGPAPVCAYGYYGYAPYACAPLPGYYGPDWFAVLFSSRPMVPWSWMARALGLCERMVRSSMVRSSGLGSRLVWRTWLWRSRLRCP